MARSRGTFNFTERRGGHVVKTKDRVLREMGATPASAPYFFEQGISYFSLPPFPQLSSRDNIDLTEVFCNLIQVASVQTKGAIDLQKAGCPKDSEYRRATEEGVERSVFMHSHVHPVD